MPEVTQLAGGGCAFAVFEFQVQSSWCSVLRSREDGTPLESGRLCLGLPPWVQAAEKDPCLVPEASTVEGCPRREPLGVVWAPPLSCIPAPGLAVTFPEPAAPLQARRQD